MMSSGQRASSEEVLAQVKDGQLGQSGGAGAGPQESERAPLRWLPFSDAPMGRQLALSEGMLSAPGGGDRAGEEQSPFFRWYLPRQRALVLGNGQSLTAVDTEAAHKRNVTVYRRTSGGTAVLVDETLISLDIALPHSHPLASADVTLAYRWVGEAWARALQAMGIAHAYALPTAAARAIPPLAKDDPLRLACYGSLSPWEVVVDDPITGQPRKLVGLCQVRRRHGALFQTGVYRRLGASRLARMLALSRQERQAFAGRLSAAAVGIADVKPAHKLFSILRIMLAVERELVRVCGAPITGADWTPLMLATAERIERERFQPLFP